MALPADIMMSIPGSVSRKLRAANSLDFLCLRLWRGFDHLNEVLSTQNDWPAGYTWQFARSRRSSHLPRPHRAELGACFKRRGLCRARRPPAVASLAALPC